MINFDVDSFGFITSCDLQDDTIIIPEEIKGIRSFSFLELPTKRIIFEGKSIDIEEQAFVGLENLEVVDMGSMNLQSCLNFEDTLSDTPLDVCLIVDDDEMVEPLINNSRFLNVFVKADVYDPDFGYKNPRWLTSVKLKKAISPTKVCLRYNQSVAYNQMISGLYFPDYIDGKEVVIDDLQLMGDFFNCFEGVTSIKLPKLEIFSFYVDNFVFGYCQRVHLSRLGDRIPVSFWDNGSLASLYIPKNIKELNGLRNQECLEYIVFQDELNVEFIDAYFAKDTPFMKKLLNKYTKYDYLKNNGFFVWNDFAMDAGNIYDEELRVPDTVRVIAGGCITASNKRKIKKLILGDNVEFIGNNAFEYCDSMKEVSFNDKLKKIGDYAFYNIELGRVVLPDSIESVGNYAFMVELYESESESKFKRTKVDYPLHAKLGEKCFDVEYDALPFN